ncbi:Bacterial extracellular solute-binding protein, family 7 [Xylophilus ampelinus]|nr:TRAP transporter substrate-binding protein [Variovorax sp.]VTY26358.1 Bacterial extracellular solute-binding protein, family 7 [Xylophilus ampelinus]
MIQTLRRLVCPLARTLALCLPLLLAGGPAWSASAAPEVRLRVVGGLAGISQYTRHERRFWAEDLARLSGGRYSASIVPFNEAGLPAQDMLNLVRLGVIPIGTVLLSQAAVEDPDLGLADMAGQNPDVATLRRTVEALRPSMAQILRERFGARLLAVYIYPAQMLFCQRPVGHLADLAGRRVRVSGMSQADFVQALKATPVFTEFADIVANVQAGNAECAVTGSMSGHTLGLDRVTRSLFTMPFSWGLALAVVNEQSWQSYPPGLQALIEAQMPKLEAAVWAESARETDVGVACNTGAEGCDRKRKGSMVASRPTADDEARRREIFARRVVPAWMKRCGAQCVALWNRTLAAQAGVRAQGPE